jgi:hypothetical protein
MEMENNEEDYYLYCVECQKTANYCKGRRYLHTYKAIGKAQIE